MSWVKSEYAPELAVLSTWLVTLLPWSVSTLSFDLAGRSVTVVAIRFLYARLQYIFGVSFGEQERPWLWFFEAPAFDPEALATANWLWVAAALVSLVPLAISVAYYADEARLERSAPVDPVRMLGGLLALVGVLSGAATVAFWLHQSVTVPVGPPFALALGFVLLTVDRDRPGRQTGDEPDLEAERPADGEAPPATPEEASEEGTDLS